MSERGASAVRSPADVLRLVVAAAALVVLLLAEALFGGAITGFVHDLLRGLDALEGRPFTVLVALVRAASVALLAAGLLAAVARGRWRALATALAAAGTGAVVFAGTVHWIEATRPALVESSGGAGALGSDGFPTSLGVAMIAALVTGAGPWLSRRRRRAAWVLTFAVAAVRFLTVPLSGVALDALLSGWVGGALAVVALGAPPVAPTPEDVVTGLRAGAVHVATLRPAEVDARGSTPYLGTTVDGGDLFVKVLGRAERDADLLFRLYRAALPRELGDERPFSTLRRAVEHEALMALVADRVGVRTPRFVGLARVRDDGFVLAFEAVRGTSLDRVAHELTDAILTGVWAQVAVLRPQRIAHRDLRLANLFLDVDGDVWLIDFGFAELAASDLLMASDVAELLASLGAKADPERVVACGRATVGDEALRSAIARLRPELLSGATRAALERRPGLIDEIRAAVVRREGDPGRVRSSGRVP